MTDGNFIKNLESTVMKDSWLEEMYGMKKAEQQNALKKLFAQVQDKNISESEKKALLARQETLQDKVDRLEAKMAVLAEQLGKNQDEIDKKADEITDLVSGVESKTNSLERDQREWTKNVIDDVFDLHKQNPSKWGADAMVAEMRTRMVKFKDTDAFSSLQNDLDILNGKQNEVKDLCEQAALYIDQRNILESQYGITKSTYDLISRNISMLDKETVFTNNDIGLSAPIYSATKLESLTGYFENPAINVLAGGNTNYQEGAKKPDLNSINEKYKEYFGVKSTTFDPASFNNAGMQSLSNAINAGMLSDLKAAGIQGKDLSDFLVNNFSGAGIQQGTNGALNIPIANDTRSREVITRLTDFVTGYKLDDDSSKWQNEAFLGVEDIWNKELGNTIDSNKQIKALNDSYEEIIGNMASGGFTFKEAMYALFDSNKGLFKDSGISYDLSKQTEKSNYFIGYAGDNQTAELYKNVAQLIYKNWGVKPSVGTENPQNISVNPYETVIPEPVIIPTPQPKKPAVNTDPLTFVKDGSEYAFVIDRDNDDMFDDKTEFVGGKEGTNWLDDLKSFDADGNGVLEGDELKNVRLLQSKINDNAQTTQKDGFITGETTTINYDFRTAEELGVESIDLKGLEDNVNKSKGTKDLNDSDLFSDGFKMKMNGEEVEVKRKDDTDKYINTVYGNAFGTRFDNKIGLSEEAVQEVMDKDYGEFEDFDKKYTNLFQNLNILNNVENIAQDTTHLVNEAAIRSDKENANILRRGQNEALAKYGNSQDWSEFSKEITDAAEKAGISVTSDFIDQAKGIHIADKSLSAEAIVQKYQDMQTELDSIEQERQNSKIAFEAVIKCAKNNVPATSAEIIQLLNSGSAKTADDVVEILKNKNGTKSYGNVDSELLKVFEERQEEIKNAFEKVFEAAGKKKQVVRALYDLVLTEQAQKGSLADKTGEQIAQEFVNRY